MEMPTLHDIKENYLNNSLVVPIYVHQIVPYSYSRQHATILVYPWRIISRVYVLCLGHTKTIYCHIYIGVITGWHPSYNSMLLSKPRFKLKSYIT